MRKIATWMRRVGEIARTEGFRAVPDAVWRGFRKRLYNIWTRDHPWQGRLVELFGNRWRVDSVSISVDNPVIATRYKALLLNGRYERPERQLLSRHLRGDLPLIELGGCIGMLACLSNRRLSHREKHLVVEANPRLIPTLEKNREANGCRFRVVNAALGYSEQGVVSFEEGIFTSGFVGSGGGISVPARSLESLADQAGFERFDLICDIEGSEKDLVESESHVLSNRVRMLIIEMHPTILGEASVDQLNARLAALGFDLTEAECAVYCHVHRASRG